MTNHRIEHLRSIMKDANVQGFLLSSQSNIFYLSGFNRFLQDHDGFLLVTEHSVHLITSPLYTEAVKKFTPDLEILETSPDAWYSQRVKEIAEKEFVKVLGFEQQDLRVSEYFDLQHEKITLQPVSLRSLRIQKTDEEIAAVEKACEVTDRAFSQVLPFVTEGVSELELAAKLEEIVRQQNAEIGFASIIAFGLHSAVPHHMTSGEKLEKNNFVLFDFGVKTESYLSDMSRTVFFFGKPSNEQVKLYETVMKSQESAIAYIDSHTDLFVKDIDRLSRDIIEKAGFPAYPHSLGHGIGLEVHESPSISTYSPEKLIDRMVFTIEPGIYLPRMGGVRIEDTCVLRDGKLELLTHSPKELIVI